MDWNRIRIPTHAIGFDDRIGGGLPQGYVILLSGAPGTMKSSFAFSIAYHNAVRDDRKAAYFTLEQSKESLLEQMSTMGMGDSRLSDRLSVLDMGTIRKNLSYLQGRETWLELFKMHCSNVIKSDAVSILIVDSLDVLEAMAKMEDGRAGLYFLFEWLRDLGPLTVVVSEKPLSLDRDATPPDEAYLADGIIQLSMVPSADGTVQRRLRVVKLRATHHDTGSHRLGFSAPEFSVE